MQATIEERKGLVREIADHDEIVAMIDVQAAKLGVSRKEALLRIEKGSAGNNFLWSHISLLAGLLHATK